MSHKGNGSVIRDAGIGEGFLSPGANLKGVTQVMSNEQLWLLKMGRRNLLQTGVTKEMILDVFPSTALQKTQPKV